MNKTMIRLAQEYLNNAGYDAGKADGIFGPKTERAIDRALKNAGKKAPAGWENWPKTRKLIAGIQIVAKNMKIDSGVVDGYWGPVTEYAYTALKHHFEHNALPPNWRDVTPSTANPNHWPAEQPQDRLTRFYGQVGENQVLLDLPYTHRLSWDLRTTTNRMSCHQKVAPSIRRVLENVLKHYGKDGIEELRLDVFGGCFNKRRKRGGTSWSTHAWGIALDYDPDNNTLHMGRDKATFALPQYDKWWDFWEAEGWVSLGRTKNYDWMHVQAARV